MTTMRASVRVGAEGNDHDVPRRESPASPTRDGGPTWRPNPGRQETDAILSYYQSADAGRDGSPSPLSALGHSDWSRTLSGSGPEPSPRPFSITSASTSSSPTSDYRESTRTNSHPLSPRAASPSAGSSTTGALRRTSIPSQGGTDRRRLAIMEMDTSRPSAQDRAEQSAERGLRSSESGGVPPSTFHPRRDHDVRLGGLALVAPPDASPQSYTALTPPKTIPVPKLQPSISAGPPVSSSHSRSSADATKALSKGRGHVPRKSSREVAIVGTANFPGAASVAQQHSIASPTESLKPPLFQIPQSRSPSPGTSEMSDSCSTNRSRQRKDALFPGVNPITEVKEVPTPVRTPNIGESKRISDRVAGPVIINLFPESPSPSPTYSSPSSSTRDSLSPRTSLSTPLTPSTALTSPAMPPSPYLFYQPGLHATAGPLPPPPQAVFNIDPKTPPPPRPPRHSPIHKKGELEAMKHALQLPPQVVAALKAKPAAPSTEKKGVSSTVSPSSQQSPTIAPTTITSPKERHLSLSSRESTNSDTKPHHLREGAFPPSRLGTVDSDTLTSSSEDIVTTLPPLDSMDDLVASIGLAIDDMGIMSSTDVPPPTVVEPPRGHEGQRRGKGLEIRRNDDRRLSFIPGTSPELLHAARVSSPRSEEAVEQSWVDPDKTITLSEEKVPPVPAKNDIPHLDTKSLKGALNIKRFSALPRTPSLMSLNRLSAGSKRSPRTPSPSVAHSVPRPRPPVLKTKSVNPPAMYFGDITVKRTSVERSIGYAHKINELYNYDCGLGDWIVETRHRALHPHSSTKRPSVNPSGGPRAPSTSSPSISPRHFSQSSIDSGVTFPRRADAYSATDLSARTAGDASPPNAPPPLPYPALAAAPRSGPSRASTMIATSSSSSTRSVASPSSSAKSPGGFFASLGRKTSLKEKPLTPPSLAKTLSKSPPRNVKELSSPRPTLQPITPTVHGGPRAPPNRMQRSQTIIITSQNSMNGGTPQRSSTMARRPSLFDGRGSVHQQLNAISDAEFNRQVDKLSALLPKADRKVLAVYLRRAGQDILAIGQYLEDEKNGTLRYE